MKEKAALSNNFKNDRKTWLIIGVAGFMGSNLLDKRLLLGRQVVGLDNFSTSKQENMSAAQKAVNSDTWSRFRLDRAKTRELTDYQVACIGLNYLLHQATLDSAPRSIKDPIKLTNPISTALSICWWQPRIPRSKCLSMPPHRQPMTIIPPWPGDTFTMIPKMGVDKEDGTDGTNDMLDTIL